MWSWNDHSGSTWGRSIWKRIGEGNDIYSSDEKAIRLMFEAHKDQNDRSGLPYVFHSWRVADRSRLDEPGPKDIARREKYLKAIEFLEGIG